MGHAAVRAAVRAAPAPGHHDDAETDQAAEGAFEARRPGRRRHQRLDIRQPRQPRLDVFSQIVRQYEGTRLGRQELDAELLEDTPGALWTRELIEEGRRAKADIPPMRRIVVAIDPAVSVSETSDETGIIVAGLGTDSQGYVLEDASGKFSPIEWASRAVTLYRKWGADRIVAEANQGGAMVETTVRTVDPNVSFKAVHASRGKITRAEPIAALAEQHRIHHVGGFPGLEDQLCSYAAGSSDSPDRLDAMVWAFTELMLGFEQKAVIAAPYVWTKSSLSPACGGSNQDEYFPSFDMPKGW